MQPTAELRHRHAGKKPDAAPRLKDEWYGRCLETRELHRIGTDPDLFEAFYRENVEGVQRFVARRVDDRDRVADLTAEIFLAAIDSSHRYRAIRGTPQAWLYGIARVTVAAERRR